MSWIKLDNTVEKCRQAFWWTTDGKCGRFLCSSSTTSCAFCVHSAIPFPPSCGTRAIWMLLVNWMGKLGVSLSQCLFTSRSLTLQPVCLSARWVLQSGKTGSCWQQDTGVFDSDTVSWVAPSISQTTIWLKMLHCKEPGLALSKPVPVSLDGYIWHTGGYLLFHFSKNTWSLISLYKHGFYGSNKTIHAVSGEIREKWFCVQIKFLMHCLCSVDLVNHYWQSSISSISVVSNSGISFCRCGRGIMVGFFFLIL